MGDRGGPVRRKAKGAVSGNADGGAAAGDGADAPVERSESQDFLAEAGDGRGRSVSPSKMHDEWAFNTIRERIVDDQHWGAAGTGGKFLGSPFDAVDILLRLCRGPCDKAAADVTTCGCHASGASIMPCRVPTYDILAKMLEEAPELARRCYPKSLHTFLEAYRKGAGGLSRPRTTLLPMRLMRNWFMVAPDDAYIDFDTSVLGQLKRSPAFALLDPADEQVWPLGRAPRGQDWHGVDDDVGRAGSATAPSSACSPEWVWSNTAARFVSSLLTGIPATPELPSAPHARDFFDHLGNFLSFPDAVGVDVCVTELLAVDEAEGNFEVMLDLNVTWFDGTLKTREWETHLDVASPGSIFVTSYCAPRIRIKDVLDGDTGWHDHNHVAENARLIGPGIVTKTVQLRCTIRDDNPIHDFPFDAQELTVEFELLNADNPASLNYGQYLLPLSVRFEPEHDLREWTVHEPVAHVTAPRGQAQTLLCAFRVTRKSAKYVVNNVLVLFLLSLLAFFTFVIPIDSAADRGSVTVTLLLTAVSFQQFLSDSLPKMAYLTLLDKYILTTFITIFVITVENASVAFLTGIEKTISCGVWKADKQGSGGECESTGGWDLSDQEAVAVEWAFLLFTVGTWFFLNVYFALRMACLVHRNLVMFGRPATGGCERNQKRDLVVERFEKLAVLRTYKGTGVASLEASVERTRNAVETFFGCERFVGVGPGFAARRPADHLAAAAAAAAASEKATQLLSSVRTVEENELMTVLLNAGYGQRASAALMPALLKDGLNVERITKMDSGLVSELLECVHIPLGKRMDILEAAANKQRVMFLQGSASYMMKELGFGDGTLVTKEDLLLALSSALRRGDDHKGDIKGGWKVSFKLTNLCNFVYTRSLLNTTVTPAMYLMSKRECKGLYNTEIYTQLWAGYAAAIANQMDEREGTRHVLVVDIGSGEMKRFHCVLARGRPLRKKHEYKDEDSIKTYEALLRKMVATVSKRLQQGARPISRVSSRGRFSLSPGPGDLSSGTEESEEVVVWETELREELALLGDALVSKALISMYVDPNTGKPRRHEEAKSLPVPSEVHFIATSSTRAFFEHPRKNESEGVNPVAVDAKRIVLDCMTATLRDNFLSKLPTCKKIEFKILDHAEEAWFEYTAAQTACAHAIDLDPLVKASGPPVTLAWGKGSTQGFCWKPPSTIRASAGAKGSGTDSAAALPSPRPRRRNNDRRSASVSDAVFVDAYAEPAAGEDGDVEDDTEPVQTKSAGPNLRIPAFSGVRSAPPPVVPDTSESIKVELGLAKVQKWVTQWANKVRHECEQRRQQSLVELVDVEKKPGSGKYEKWICFKNRDIRKECESVVRARIKATLRGDITTRPIKVFEMEDQ